jgi:bifunctional enzyme CysN/CysC/sulfate adenylyltransferase subunit 1
MNGIAEVEFASNLPLFFDPYTDNRMMGALILIDAVTNATVGAGMLTGAVDAGAGMDRPALVLVSGRPELAERVRAALGEDAVVVETDGLDDEAVRAMLEERR